VIRGLTGDRVLVLKNGERTADLSAAAADHALTIDPLAAQRIEVVRGPASLLYGSNAIGGVVNVIESTIPTAIPLHLEGHVATQGESVSPGGAGSASLTVPLSQSFAFSVRGNYRGMSDTRQGGGAKLLNSASHQGGGAVGLGFIGSHAKGGLSYEALKFKYGLPGEADDPELGAKIRGTRHQVVARSDFIMDRAGLTFLQLNASAQWYQHDEVEVTDEIATSFDLKTQTANATARTQWGPLNGAIGIQGLFKQYAAIGEEALTPAANSNAGGLFIYQDLPLSSGDSARVPRLQLGARYDLYSIRSKAGDPKFGAPRALRFNNTSGSIGLVVPIRSGISVNGNLSRAFRAPTVEELFSNSIHSALGTYDIGNPDLKAETNNGAEIVFRAQSARLNAQLSGYYNRVNNYITGDIVGDTVVEGVTIPLNRYTQGDATLKGVEGNIESAIAHNIVVGAMGDIVRGRMKNGDPLPFMPAARLGTHIRYDNGALSLGADYRHGFKQTRVPVAVSSIDPSAMPTDAYNVVNLSAGYRLIERGFVHAITLRVDNIFDEKYKDATSRIKGFAFNPGRNISLVYKVLF
jgi:iron complex outermembrane receptor protein